MKSIEEELKDLLNNINQLEDMLARLSFLNKGLREIEDQKKRESYDNSY